MHSTVHVNMIRDLHYTYSSHIRQPASSQLLGNGLQVRDVAQVSSHSFQGISTSCRITCMTSWRSAMAPRSLCGCQRHCASDLQISTINNYTSNSFKWAKHNSEVWFINGDNLRVFEGDRCDLVQAISSLIWWASGPTKVKNKVCSMTSNHYFWLPVSLWSTAVFYMS